MRRMAREVISELVPGILREITDEPGRGANGNGAARTNGHRNGVTQGPAPQVPAPPIAAVLRPSTWNRPAAPGEVIGQPGPAGAVARPAPTAARPAPTAARSAPTAAGPAPTAARPAPTPRERAEHPPEQTAPARTAIANPGAGARVEVVTIDTDDDLMQFVRQLLSRITNPRDRLAIHTGKLRFALRSRPGLPPAGAIAPAGPVTRIAKGAVTERVIRDAANTGTRLVLAPGTVLTPLARERAQALGVEIERERK
jgi:hypothetical protein